MPSTTSGSGGNCVIVDLDLDGANDIVIADVEIDLPGCNRVADILRNDGGPDVTFTADSGKSPRRRADGGSIFDLNGDGWNDLILGRCVGMRVWIAQPPCSADIDGDGVVMVTLRSTTLNHSSMLRPGCRSPDRRIRGWTFRSSPGSPAPGP